MTQTVCHLCHIADARVRFQISSRGICGGSSWILTDCSPNTSTFPRQYHSTIAPYSFIHLPPTLYKVFTQYFSFPCQYHSTIAPYSFIHLPPTLYCIFLPVLQCHSTIARYSSSFWCCSYQKKRGEIWDFSKNLFSFGTFYRQVFSL